MTPTVFISSTIEDLHHVRDAVRETVINLGYQPIMSEYGGVGYMIETAADVACYRSVKECQLMVLIIGKRYGSKTHDSGSVSVTEHEYDTCMEYKPRLITFVDKEVLYNKRINDGNQAHDCSINYPGMDDASATFAFIEKVAHSPVHNAIIPFSSVSEVREQLKQQLAGLFHELLEEHANAEKTSLDEIMAEVKTIRNALSQKTTPDMRYLTVVKFLLDDKNQTFKAFLKKSIDDFENSIPLIYTSKDFDEFTAHNKLAIEIIDVPDCFPVLKDKNDLRHASTFTAGLWLDESGEPRPNKCSYAICDGGKIFMNNEAYDFFTKVYADLKLRVERAEMANALNGHQ